MKKILYTLFFALASTTQVMAQPVTKSVCLPQTLNSTYTGTGLASFAYPGKGSVISWDCPEVDGKPYRYAIVTLESYRLNPMCATLGIDRFRLPETNVTTSVYNLLKVCGAAPVGEVEKKTYSLLMQIGNVRPEFQEALALSVFGPRPINAASSPKLP